MLRNSRPAYHEWRSSRPPKRSHRGKQAEHLHTGDYGTRTQDRGEEEEMEVYRSYAGSIGGSPSRSTGALAGA